jgi:hypothetical protein
MDGEIHHYSVCIVNSESKPCPIRISINSFCIRIQARSLLFHCKESLKSHCQYFEINEEMVFLHDFNTPNIKDRDEKLLH